MRKEYRMEELRRLLDEVLDFSLIQGTVSGPRKKEGTLKIKVLGKNKLKLGNTVLKRKK